MSNENSQKPNNMQRVLILGICGSGKSTLGRELAKRLKLPLFHLDQLFWNQGWVSSSLPDLKAKLLPILERESWIIEGNYASTLPERLPRADTVIILHISKWRALWRCLKRVIVYWGRSRPDMPVGCPERFDLEFFRYIWNFHRNQSRVTEEWIAKYSHYQVLRLNTQKEIDQFLTLAR